MPQRDAPSRRPRRVLPFLEAGVLIALLLVPQVTSEFHTIIASRMLLLAMLAISFDLCWGYSGIMTFGQALFFGGAGYVSALLANNAGFLQIWRPGLDAGRPGWRILDRVVPAARGRPPSYSSRSVL